MAIRKILQRENDVLHKRAHPVTNFDERLSVLLDDMRDTLLDSGGVGLAAPQIGILRRVVLVLDENDEILELVNPEIIETEGEQDGPEGCLSVTGDWGLVKRPMRATVRAFDRNGEEFTVTGTGLTARAFCHETDHLEGVLFTERAYRMLSEAEIRRLSEED